MAMTEGWDFNKLVVEGQRQVDDIVGKAGDYGAYEAQQMGSKLLQWQNALICRLAFAEGRVLGLELRIKESKQPYPGNEIDFGAVHTAAIAAGFDLSDHELVSKLRRFVEEMRRCES